jgi:hypothetical protein
MIIIDIKNAKDVARREKGRLKVFFATLFGIDMARKVDEVVAERIADELRHRNIEAEVRIEPSPDRRSAADGRST